ncbi:hypothetical protein HDF14_001539 [Edaphobacter lichenicola]|uniref:Uncharacterized protein n=1 Tax=Tunturiibacter gelidiferens TaxID=3069689 RepID=A0A9X0QCQ2_9BACT|nr:hypothetical protein [Edaphobacter lichenicola]
MLYRLSFNKTDEGLLRVSASTEPSSEQVISMYDDDQVFLHLVGYAGLGPEIEQAIRTAVQIGFGPANTPSCCEEVELNDHQLALLRLGTARRLHPPAV